MAVIKNEYFIPNKIMLEKLIGKVLHLLFTAGREVFELLYRKQPMNVIFELVLLKKIKS